ncbi:poly(ADP-ribose) glycohydrolase, partial [Reticulomyxa filosa]
KTNTNNNNNSNSNSNSNNKKKTNGHNGRSLSRHTTRTLSIHRHKVPSKVVTYLQSEEGLLTNQTPLCPVDLLVEGKIEDSIGDFQIDFANKFIGGGVFTGGCVQEVVLRIQINKYLFICINFAFFFFFFFFFF